MPGAGREATQQKTTRGNFGPFERRMRLPITQEQANPVKARSLMHRPSLKRPQQPPYSATETARWQGAHCVKGNAKGPRRLVFLLRARIARAALNTLLGLVLRPKLHARFSVGLVQMITAALAAGKFKLVVPKWCLRSGKPGELWVNLPSRESPKFLKMLSKTSEGNFSVQQAL
jgi:hypothetical protein